MQYEWERWCRCNDGLKTYSSLRLANSLLICIHQKEIVKFFGKRPASAKAHFEERYPEHARSAFNPTEELEELLDRLKMMADKSRKSAWVSRVSVEANEANDAGWYIIFDTISVNPKKELSLDGYVLENGKEWSKYVQRVEEAVRQALGYDQQSRGGPKRSSYARYFCRFEGGKNGNNPHGHVIWFLKDVPEEWKRDPNLHNDNPIKTEIAEMKELWPWGMSWHKPRAMPR